MSLADTTDPLTDEERDDYADTVLELALQWLPPFLRPVTDAERARAAKQLSTALRKVYARGLIVAETNAKIASVRL